MIKEIPESEFQERIEKIQEKLVENNYDAYLVHSNEADQANVRYLSDHWPIFETAGVIVPKEGEPILLIGPEAEPFARDRSKIKKIRKLLAYRESAEPEYPDIEVCTFGDIFDEISNGKGIHRLALGDYTILPMPVYDGVREAMGDKGEIIRAEWIIAEMRMIKSENEIALMKEAHRISELALEDALKIMKPGMTEKEVVGILYDSMYRHGAECEAFPNYVFGGKKTRNAIGRATYDKLKEGELIQLCVGARFGGYASSVGRPVIFGKMPEEMREKVQFGLDVHKKTFEWIREGVAAKDIAIKFYDYYQEHGYAQNYLYGPCHGTGIIEVERPWMEKTSDYQLKENMAFMADTFFTSSEYGFRWEDGFRVTEDGCEVFSSIFSEIIEL
ncbi:MAG TPA: Xaa-Pro peptidase family protein [Candidatus Atribacteria bacterium]|mgnify:CR=1 FL=1|nr:Xaa-Pro peptidase family protein [Candidatus Atribacteria bacterium]